MVSSNATCSVLGSYGRVESEPTKTIISSMVKVGEVPPLVVVAVVAALRAVRDVALVRAQVVLDGHDVRARDGAGVTHGEGVVLRRIAEGAPRLVEHVAAEGLDVAPAPGQRLLQLFRGLVRLVVEVRPTRRSHHLGAIRPRAVPNRGGMQREDVARTGPLWISGIVSSQ